MPLVTEKETSPAVEMSAGDCSQTAAALPNQRLACDRTSPPTALPPQPPSARAFWLGAGRRAPAPWGKAVRKPASAGCVLRDQQQLPVSQHQVPNGSDTTTQWHWAKPPDLLPCSMPAALPGPTALPRTLPWTCCPALGPLPCPGPDALPIHPSHLRTQSNPLGDRRCTPHACKLRHDD